MPYDGYTQVAPDSTGKKIDMDVVSTAAGTTLYREKAILVGETADILQSMFMVQLQQLACLRALLSISQSNNPNTLGEADFTQDLTPNDI